MFEFLFKYSPVVFERGNFAFSAPWPVYLVAIVAAALAVPTVLRYRQVPHSSDFLLRWIMPSAFSPPPRLY